MVMPRFQLFLELPLAFFLKGVLIHVPHSDLWYVHKSSPLPFLHKMQFMLENRMEFCNTGFVCLAKNCFLLYERALSWLARQILLQLFLSLIIIIMTFTVGSEVLTAVMVNICLLGYNQNVLWQYPVVQHISTFDDGNTLDKYFECRTQGKK
jgi:hypothetical protein